MSGTSNGTTGLVISPIESPKMAAAHKAREKLPPNWRDHKFSREREAWARNILRSCPEMTQTEVREALHEKFGVGIQGTKIGALKRQIKREQVRAVKRGPSKEVAEEVAGPSGIPLPVPMQAPTKDPATAIRATLELLLAEVPDLRELHVTLEGERRAVTYRVGLR